MPRAPRSTSGDDPAHDLSANDKAALEGTLRAQARELLRERDGRQRERLLRRLHEIARPKSTSTRSTWEAT